MGVRTLLVLTALLLLAGCASGPTTDAVRDGSEDARIDGPTVDTVRDALEDAGIDVAYVRTYSSLDADFWVGLAEPSAIGLDLSSCLNPGIALYEFSTEQEASQAAQGELPGGPQDFGILWAAQPHLFQRGRLVAMVGFVPLSSQLDERETAAMEADAVRVLEVLEAQMGTEKPFEGGPR